MPLADELVSNSSDDLLGDYKCCVLGRFLVREPTKVNLHFSAISVKIRQIELIWCRG